MKNLSKVERVIRVVVGGGILGWGIAVRSWWGIVGLALIISGLIGFCALYKVMGACCPLFGNKAGQGSGCCSKQDKPKRDGCGCGH
jgi:hypothetical protein